MTFPLYFIKKKAKTVLNFGNYLVFSCLSKKKFEKQNIQKILLINFQGVGDIVMTTPLLSALRAEYPLAQIDYFCAKENGAILFSDARVSHILSRKKDDLFSLDFIQTVQQIRSQQYDLVLNVFPAPHSALLALSSRGRYIAGPFYSIYSVCNWSSQKMKSTWDVRIQCQQIASLLGILLPSSFLLSLSVSSSQKKIVLNKLNLKKITSKEKYIIFNTPAQWKAKQWPVAYWRELVHLILAEKKYAGYQLAFLGTASDKDSVEQILTAFGENRRLENWCGIWTLEELPALLQHASLFITTDSGPMHIASAVGTKTIGLFGVTDPKVLVAGNPFIHVISSYDSCPKEYHFNHHSEPYDKEQICMKKIAPQKVFERVKQLL